MLTYLYQGVQKKLLVKEFNGKFTITNGSELSTHIAKLSSTDFKEIIELEFLSSLLVKHILPHDIVTDMEIGKLLLF